MVTDLTSVVHNPSRLAALRSLALLDTPPEPQFERLTQLATKVLNAPVALISLVDDARQYFKSAVGLPEPWASQRQSPLSLSFCKYVVASNKPLIVRDARRHAVLCTSRAIPELGVVSYAGVPLALEDGQIIGSFCVIDRRPRAWTSRQVEILHELAALVMTEIRLRAVNQAVQLQQTESVARAEQLRLYREIIANSNEAIAIIDRNGCYIEQNRAHCDLIGYSDGELHGQTPAIHFGEQTFERILQELVANDSFRGEVTTRARSGELREIELSAFAVRDATGEPLCYVGIKRDITQRKRAEEALRRRFDQLQVIYHMADTVSHAYNDKEIFIAAVAGLQRALNIDRAALLLFDPDRVVRFKAWYRLSAAYRRAVEGHSPWPFQETDPQPILVRDVQAEPSLAPYLSAISAEGIRSMAFIPLVYNSKLLGKFMLYYDTPHDFSDEEIQLAQTIANHIGFATERRRNDEAQRFLIEASTLLVSLLDYETTLASVAELAVPHLADWCIIDILGADGTLQQMAVSHIEPGKASLVRELRRRYPPDPDEQHSIWRVLRTCRSELASDIADDLLAQRARDAEHLELLRSIGIKSHMVVPLVARGRILGAISFVSGASGRRYSSNDLALAEELARRAAFAVDNARLYTEAQEALKARDQFLSIAAHELKTPITALLGYAQLLERRVQRGGAYSPRELAVLNALIDQSRRLHRLSVSLLELSRIQIGTFSIESGPLDIVALTRRVINELQTTVENHSLQLAAPDTSIVIEGDELRLEQVLLNLLHNAVKYSPSGGSVITRIDLEDQQVRISVRDWGIGIPDDARSKLFSRFYRASNVDPQQISGMGLGLYVVKEIVSLHGGTVEVESKVGEGSTFTIRLPCSGTAGTLPAQPQATYQSLASR